MKVLITGGSGFLGQYLNKELSRKHKIFTLHNQNIGNCINYNSMQLDIRDRIALVKLFQDFNPEVVIHTAAISNPAAAQSLSAKEVYKINVDSTKIIAELCKKSNAKLIYLSTDLVYAGYRGAMLKEDSKIVPVSLYAETKLMGEVKIQETFDDFIILRTALMYGFGLHHSKSHFHQMYDSLKESKEVKLFVDQFRTPLSVLDAARMISELLEQNIKTEIFNFGGVERISRYELGERLCDVAGLNKNKLIKITMDDIPNLPKVEDVSMNCEKLNSCGIRSSSISDAIEIILLRS